MSQIVAKLLLGGALAVILPSCYGTQLASDRRPGPVALAYNFTQARALHDTEPAATPVIAAAVIDRGSVAVRGFHEPGDFAHRNYCGAGATQVLLSGWMANVPDIETVAARSHLNPNRGEYGADALAAINGFLDPIVSAQLGRPWYRAEHITTLDGVMTRVRSDILDPTAIQAFGHGVPVIVQTMTRTMPGWNHWNATHMIAIFAFDFSHNDPLKDTVTYAETPSPLAGYRGPDFQTISVQALWVAMQQYNVQAPYDPLNVIW
ncbi:MAG TPA: hypothetical protein VET65_13460 [Candidatus Limnocylindrales bacterium]|nr:hypothetical protein [Candidatus Limnocylindrales bacterium]